ncbi:GGDEF domain-containing protein [Acetobacter sacchari]|uniref:diguanylate cyclase n=1 Tax=Acetobacter sacchari TaxID=2661687 RepID=A0ABS3LYF2_9PROT|nr:GGDEF domain-containing protein [Acetobacter sacchari]MBO1360950.1 GGDEF domain-containing protein [Acetobacter sacchari]
MPPSLGAHFFASLLNPGVSLLLAVAFGLLWRHNRSQVYPKLAAYCYAVMTAAFVLAELIGPEYRALSLIANIGFLLSSILMSASIIIRYEVGIPFLIYSLIFSLMVISYSVASFVDNCLTCRLYNVNFALGSVSLLTAFKMSKAQRKHVIDNILFVLCFLVSANYFIRPILLRVLFSDNFSAFHESLYWATTIFAQIMISVAVALNLLIAIAVDQMMELRREAHTDKLSGLLNRDGFDHALQALRNAERGKNEPIALVIADLDHFKRINDTFGHGVGDAVIAAFGCVVRDTLYDRWIAARFGGEEFSILMYGVTPSEAYGISEKIRRKFEIHCRDNMSGRLRATVSMGLTLGTLSGDIKRLYTEADSTLYEAKRAGRNNVKIHVFDEKIEGFLSQKNESCLHGVVS